MQGEEHVYTSDDHELLESRRCPIFTKQAICIKDNDMNGTGRKKRMSRTSAAKAVISRRHTELVLEKAARACREMEEQSWQASSEIIARINGGDPATQRIMNRIFEMEPRRSGGQNN
jgi:hypothetical protein